MKRIILALIVYLSMVSCLEAQYEGPENITCKEASDLIQKLSKNSSFVILDLRPERMFKEEHIKNAIFRDVFADGFENWLEGLDKDHTYLLYCKVGYRSGIAMEKMKQAGFKNLHHLDKGIREWIEQGFPISRESDSLMVLIHAGEFTMGKDSKKGSDYSPAHKVKVDSFYIDKHQVTNGEYLRYCKETGHRLPEFWNMDFFRCGENYLNYPVIGINLGDAKQYAKWAGKRLPTEAEWEYAARGGLIDMDFPRGNMWTRKPVKQDINCWNNLIDPVETYKPNGFGIYDMSGHIWEWVNDIYSADYYEVSEVNNPMGPGNGKHQVIRGGSWHSGLTCKKVYYRQALPGHWCDYTVGFRCVKDIALDDNLIRISTEK